MIAISKRMLMKVMQLVNEKLRESNITQPKEVVKIICDFVPEYDYSKG